jgi:polysaccharide export outer membrane protein
LSTFPNSFLNSFPNSFLDRVLSGPGALIAAALLLTAACETTGPYVWVDDLPAQRGQPPYKLHPGDRIMIHVWNQPPMSGEVLVRSDGNITLPLVGDIPVAGQTPLAASESITKRLTGLVVEPHVAVSVLAGRSPTVNVTGEVRQSGSFDLRPGEGLLELIARAGGLSEFAARDRIFVVRREQAQRVRFRYDKLSRADGPAASFELRDGDIIVVE